MGFEVEEHSPFVNGNGLVFGTIESFIKHPNADTLNILKVNIGSEIIQIITGATNVAKNKQGIVCLPGTQSNGIKYEIKKLRGLESYGMLASLDELGIPKDVLPSNIRDGIQLFDPIYKNGDDVLKTLKLNDVIVNIDILPNRSDIYGYYFLSKELSAHFKTNAFEIPIHKTNPTYNCNITVKKGLENHITMFEAKMMDGESDFETKIFLMKSSIKPINKIVDLTNLALILFGQAVHVYDKDLIGKTFECKLFSGDVETINETKLSLKDNLVMFSNGKPTSIAGVIGLKNSMVNSKTKNVVFEIANFNTKDIRNSIQTSKINNITSSKNSNKTSLNLIPLAVNFLQGSLKEYSNETNPYNAKEKIIKLDDNFINEYAGFSMTEDSNYKNALEFLKKLGYKIKNNEYITPQYRYDIYDMYDIIEDIFRGYGYNNIPMIQPKITSSYLSKNENIKKNVALQNYSEVITYSLQDETYNSFNPFNIVKNINILNPIALKRNVYRHTIISSLFEIANRNLKFKLEKFSLFEIGYINGCIKEKHLALISTDKSLKDMQKNVMSILSNRRNISFVPTKCKELNEFVSVDILENNEYIGFIGRIRPTFSLGNSKYNIAEILINSISPVNIHSLENKAPLLTRTWTVKLGNNEHILKHIELLKTQMHYIFLNYLGTYQKNESEKTITFQIYFDKKKR